MLHLGFLGYSPARCTEVRVALEALLRRYLVDRRAVLGLRAHCLFLLSPVLRSPLFGSIRLIRDLLHLRHRIQYLKQFAPQVVALLDLLGRQLLVTRE